MPADLFLDFLPRFLNLLLPPPQSRLFPPPETHISSSDDTSFLHLNGYRQTMFVEKTLPWKHLWLLAPTWPFFPLRYLFVQLTP